jgi:hypothetical protein
MLLFSCPDRRYTEGEACETALPERGSWTDYCLLTALALTDASGWIVGHREVG